MALLMLILPTMLVLVGLARAALYWRRRRQLPPGPPSWPIIGSLHLLLGGAPHRSLAMLSQKYGPFVYLMLGSMPTVIVSSPQIAKQFLHTHDRIFASRPPFTSANRLSCGQDLATATTRYGEGWRKLRRLYAVELFTAKRVNQFFPVVQEEIKGLMEEIRGYADAGITFNITKAMGELLENIICRILMGKRLCEVCEVEEGYSLKELVHQGAVLFGIPMIGDLIPWLGFLDCKAKGRMDAWHASFDALLEGVLIAREAEAGHAISRDFLDVVLAQNLPRDRVKAVIVELLVGGIDTSSVTLDWAMAELMLNPKILKKVEEEVERVVGYTPNRIVQEEDLPQLIYTKAIVKEILRLHSPLPLLATHMSTEECEVGGYKLSKGTRLLVNAWAIGHDPQIWDHSDVFLPDRFLEACEHVDVRGNHFELLPFGAGRRSCPGAPLALPIIEMVLANLVYYFHWFLPPPPHHIVDMSEKFGAIISRGSALLAIPTLRTNQV